MNQIFVLFGLLALSGCSNTPKEQPKTTETHPFEITLYFSEYPSWSVFGVAGRQGLIDAAKGKLGPIEKRWNVDLEVKMITYDACLVAYGNGGGAICMTNTEAVGLVAKRPSTAIMPTSTSYGADACIGTGNVTTVDALKGQTTYGLANSVSDYAFFRGLEKLGQDPRDFKFANRDPEQAAQALQTGASKVGQLWNPFTLQTLRTKKDAKIIFDSTIIPNEIVDMVVIDNATLQKSGGKSAAICICDTFYQVCDNLKTKGNLGDKTYIALGDQFSSLGLNDMKLCADMASSPDPSKKITTRFYDTPELGSRVFSSQHMKPIMADVIRWAKIRQIIKEEPAISYAEDATQAPLKFDAWYMKTLH